MSEFDNAVGDLYRTAYRVAYRMLGSQHDAEEVAQEVCARALVHWPKVEGYAQAWVARSAGNLVLDRLRRSRRRLPGLPVVQPPPDPDRIDLVRALRSLPGRQREVVVLRYLADLSEKDVATKLGCSVGTVKQHATRGLSALRAGVALNLEEGR
jgi:DNA-directed RNA polymerase specialized sigma24 family protein